MRVCVTKNDLRDNDGWSVLLDGAPIPDDWRITEADEEKGLVVYELRSDSPCATYRAMGRVELVSSYPGSPAAEILDSLDSLQGRARMMSEKQFDQLLEVLGRIASSLEQLLVSTSYLRPAPGPLGPNVRPVSADPRPTGDWR
jgi:hypothetical protein